jgi:hypothetical protein
MSGAVPPLSNTPLWRGGRLKHRDNFTYTFLPLGYVMLCYVMLCYVMLCYVMLS